MYELALCLSSVGLIAVWLKFEDQVVVGECSGVVGLDCVTDEKGVVSVLWGWFWVVLVACYPLCGCCVDGCGSWCVSNFYGSLVCALV